VAAEKRIPTEEMIDEKLNSLRPREVRYIDPMKLAQWTLDTACAMVDDAIGKQTIQRAIADGELEAFKVGKEVTVEPAKFLVWYRRYRK
jgi:RPA family protein